MRNVIHTKADVIEIKDVGTLDPIRVYWQNTRPGVGSVTITCYDRAWTASFAAMSGKSIQDFFVQVDREYLIGKLENRSDSKLRKRDFVFLGRVVDAIQNSLLQEKENRARIRTIVIWHNEIYDETKYFVLPGDYRQFDQVYLRDYHEDPDAQKQLAALVFGAGNTGSVEFLDEFPSDLAKEESVVVIRSGIYFTYIRS